VTSCILVATYQRFGVACLYLSRYTTSDPKRTVIFALIEVTTSNLTGLLSFWISQERSQTAICDKDVQQADISSEADRRPAGYDLLLFVEHVGSLPCLEEAKTVTLLRAISLPTLKYYLSMNVCVIGFAVKVPVHVSYIVVDLVIPIM